MSARAADDQHPSKVKLQSQGMKRHTNHSRSGSRSYFNCGGTCLFVLQGFQFSESSSVFIVCMKSFLTLSPLKSLPYVLRPFNNSHYFTVNYILPWTTFFYTAVVICSLISIFNMWSFNNMLLVEIPNVILLHKTGSIRTDWLADVCMFQHHLSWYPRRVCEYIFLVVTVIWFLLSSLDTL